MNEGNVSDVLDIHAASIFRVEVYKLIGRMLVPLERPFKYPIIHTHNCN
jgi:hypothetical protein